MGHNKGNNRNTRGKLVTREKKEVHSKYENPRNSCKEIDLDCNVRKNNGAMDWMFVSPPNSYVENLMLIGIRGFGMWLGPEDGTIRGS